MIRILDERTKIKWDDARARGDGLITILHSDYRWRKTRKAHIQRECCCQMCGLERKLEVHHIKPWHLAPELRYEETNLITLCRECHYRFGHYLNWKHFNPEIRQLCTVVQQFKEKVNETSTLDPGRQPDAVVTGGVHIVENVGADSYRTYSAGGFDSRISDISQDH
jgi:hypothetical protein